jgi:hypothetical protein
MHKGAAKGKSVENGRKSRRQFRSNVAIRFRRILLVRVFHKKQVVSR